MELHFSFVEERFKDICCQREDASTLLMGEGAGRRQTLSGTREGPCAASTREENPLSETGISGQREAE